MAKTKGFDLAAALADVSRVDTAQEQLQLLPYDTLLPDEGNGYSMDGIEELARSIEITGLLQPLRVRPVPETENAWKIVAGHRRHAAIGLLIGRGCKRFQNGVPCIVDRSEASPALQELQLLLANADNRKMTPADEAQQIDRISDCLRRLEAEGFHFEGRHRDWVSKLSGMSKTKIARLQAIGNNLIPELIGPWNAGKIPETTAYELQKLGLPYQLEAFKRMNKRSGFDAAPAEKVAWCAEHEKAYAQTLDCPDGGTCSHHTGRVSASLTAEFMWSRCDGGCCMKCGVLDRCKYPCWKAAQRKKDEKIVAERAKESRKAKEAAERERGQKKARKAVQKDAQRLLPVIEAAGLADAARMPYKWYGTISVGTVRKYAAGDFGANDVQEDELRPTQAHSVRQMAKLLQTSTDFLLGLTEDPRPRGISAPAPTPAPAETSPEWKTGPVPGDGCYACRFRVSEDVKDEVRSMARYRDGEWWSLTNSYRLFDDLILVGWYKIPEV